MQPPHCLPSVDQLDLGLEGREGGGREGEREGGGLYTYINMYMECTTCVKKQLHVKWNFI